MADTEIQSLSVQLLGGFVVDIDGRQVTASEFERPLAAKLVKLLALADDRIMHREQVIDALWPDRTVEQAGPQLHKMASYVRKALGDKAALTFHGDQVTLWPDRTVDVDVAAFERLAVAGDPAAIERYRGDLLPDELYEDWVGPTRDRLRMRYLETLRAHRRWHEVLDLEPADEQAHVALMHDLLADGQRLAALRQFERLEAALHRDLGVSPSDEALALRGQIVGDVAERAELVGREQERFGLRRALDDAKAEAGSVVLLSGPAGIGKSSLAAWLADRAESEGFAVGRSTASAPDDPRPYVPMLEAIDDVIRQRRDLLAELPQNHVEEIVRVRDVAETDHTMPVDGDGHERLFVALDSMAQLAADEYGLCLLIDDVHLADQASIDVIAHLARRARRQRCLIVITARTSPDSGRIEAVRSMVSALSGWELRLGPLDGVEARQLIESAGLDDEAIETIVSLGGGTPFHLEQLARAKAAGADLPSRIADLARVWLDGVEPDVRAALSRLAVVGPRFDTDEFVALAGVSESAAFDLLDQALDGQVIEHTSLGYRFRHGLVRESLLDELAPHQRRRIHAEAAEQLEQAGAAPAQLAHHLVEAGRVQAAAPWALSAAQAAIAVGAMSDALEAIAPVVDLAEGEVRFGLLLARADAMAGMSDPGAFGAYQTTLGEAPPFMHGIIKAKMAMACLMSGDADTANAVMDGVEPDGGPFDGPILQVQGILAYVSRDLDTADDRVAAARQIAFGDATNTSARLLDVVTLQGMVAHDRGEWFDRMGVELKSMAGSNELASTVFDCHL